MAILVLKQNSHEIREKIKQAGIEVCECAEFKDSVWLSYTGATPNKIHGVGYYDEEVGIKSIQDELDRFVTENKGQIWEFFNVDAFIEMIKKNIDSEKEKIFGKKVYDFKEPLSDKETEALTKMQQNIVEEGYFGSKKEFVMKEIIKPKVFLPTLSRQTIVHFDTLPYILDGNSLNAQELAFEVVKRIVEDYNKSLKNKSGFIVADDEKISTNFYPDIKFEYAKIDGEQYKLDFKVEFKRRYDEKEEAK